MRRERRNGVIMSESYAVNEKRELILQKVKEFIVAHGGIVKKNQLEELHIDYRRILDFVEKGDLIRIKSGYYTIRIGDYSEDELIVKLFPDAVLTMECAHKRAVMGTGLGLSIVKNILELHHAGYGVVSEPGCGSTFWFELKIER